MQVQRCPNCQKRNDVSVYVHGQLARCVQCGIRFTVDRESAAPDVRGTSNPRGEAPKMPDGPTEISALRAGALDIPSEPRVAFPDPPREAPVADLPQIASNPHQVTNAQRANAKPADDAGKGEARPNIPGYDVTTLLGRGGMGEVWKARQLSLGRVVALKILSPTLAVEPDFVRRFERESSALAALAHPHIVQVFDRGSANGHWFFTMEFVEGRSLRDKHAETPLSRQELLRLMAQVARAVDYAHQKGVIHRDLKPENILVDHQGNAKVADFGLAGMSEVGRSSLTMTAVAMGTAHYMAPEQRKDAKNVDGRADLYSLGVMLYELMTGELPAGRFKTPKEKVPELDKRLDEIVLKLLDQDPNRRPRRALEVAELLDVLVAGPRSELSAPAPVHTTKILSSVVRQVRDSTAKKAMVAGAAALLLLVLGIAVWKGSGDVDGVLLPAKIERGTGTAAVTFGAGEKDAVNAIGGGWSSTAEGLVRVASSPGPRAPRAYVTTPRLDLENARIEADVTLDETRGGSEAPSAELVFYKDTDEYVGFRLAIAEDAGYQLFYSTPKTGMKSVTSDHEPDSRPGKPHHLELYVISGRVTAFVDRRQVASASVSGLSGEKAKAGLGCRVGRCRFANVKLAGTLSDPPAAPSAPAAQNKQ